MKIIGNLDATGNIKLRGKVLDRLTTRGSFYSGQFGEIAYKADLPEGEAGAEVNFFYCLGIRTSDGTHHFKGINSITLMGDNFYIEGNNLNTDEVFVTLGPLKTARYVETNSSSLINTGDHLQTVVDHTIPAGRLQAGGTAEINAYGTEVSTLSTNGFYYNMFFEDVLIYKMNIDHPHASASVLHDWQHRFIITQVSPVEGFVFWHWEASEGAITAPVVGDSDFVDAAERTFVCSAPFYTNPDIARNFKFRVRAESRTSTYTKLHETIEYW